MALRARFFQCLACSHADSSDGCAVLLHRSSARCCPRLPLGGQPCCCCWLSAGAAPSPLLEGAVAGSHCCAAATPRRDGGVSDAGDSVGEAIPMKKKRPKKKKKKKGKQNEKEVVSFGQGLLHSAHGP